MFRNLLQRLIRLKNPGFIFSPQVTGLMLFSLAFDKLFCFMRGLVLEIVHFKKPTFLLLGKNVKFFNIFRIHFGQYVQIGDYCFLSGLGKDGLFIGNHTTIGAFSRLVISTTFNNPGSHIRIGNHVGIGEFAYLGGGGGLEIGDECIIGQYLSCHPENHLYTDRLLPIRLNGVSRKGIQIGRNCWIGSKVTILDGVTIGPNCIIAAGAVVNKSFSANSIIGGVPARLLKNTHTTTQPIPVTLPENPILFT